MAHKFTFTVSVEIERESGKFASRDELSEAVLSWLESADEGSIDGVGADGDSSYTTTTWEVAEA